MLGSTGDGRRRRVHGGGWPPAALRNDGGFPAAKGWDGLVWELRESEVELGVGSAQAERPWRTGATVSSSSRGVRVGGGGVLGVWGGKLARE